MVSADIPCGWLGSKLQLANTDYVCVRSSESVWVDLLSEQWLRLSSADSAH